MINLSGFVQIGLHNGYTYLEEPESMHLTYADEVGHRTQVLKRKTRSSSNYSLDSRSCIQPCSMKKISKFQKELIFLEKKDL